MAKRIRYQNRIELLQGTLDMLILRTLQWGPQHGHGIGQSIRAQSDDLLKVETGSLYPALHRPDHEPGPPGPRGVAMGIRSWLRRRHLDEDDFKDEIQAHLALAAEEKM